MPVLGLDLVPALLAALEDGSLALHYQPEVDLRTGALTGMEGLLRWRHPELGLLRPGDFMPIAEAAGMVRALGRWVLRTGVAEMRSWCEARPPSLLPKIWLNIASVQLTRPGFEVEIERLVRGRALPRGVLGLEFTEETLGVAGPEIPRVLRQLRALGTPLAIDDFGTWYAALSTLDNLPIDVVKLDGRFLRSMMRDLEGEAVIASIVSLAHKRGLVVTAEGVETVEAASRLTGLGCDRAAGQLFCGPLPPEQARDIVLGRRPGPWMRPAPSRGRRAGGPGGPGGAGAAAGPGAGAGAGAGPGFGGPDFGGPGAPGRARPAGAGSR